MAEESPISPVSAAEPPKSDPLSKPAAASGSTLKLNPVIRKPATGAAPALKPGLKLPPKPGATVAALRPGLKLPPKPGAATQTALKPGLKLPAKPAGATQTALKPGINLPPRPQIRKPGETSAAKPLPKPIIPASAAAPAAADVPKPAEEPKPVEAPKPIEASKPVEAAPVVAKVDQAGVAKLSTVEMPTVNRDEPIVTPEPVKPMEALKSVTQKLKGITQSIPQQAILHKTGIIADAAKSDAQKEAAKHKTARISLADAIGAAPVKNENAPMKTIKIKRPIEIPGATKTLTPKPAEPVAAPAGAAADDAEKANEPDASVTQRKTLKISRPGAVRPAGKFGIKRPGAPAAAPAANDAAAEKPADTVDDAADIPEIADIPAMPAFAAPAAVQPAASGDGPAWLCAISAIVQLAACLAIGALAWYLFQDTQIATF